MRKSICHQGFLLFCCINLILLFQVNIINQLATFQVPFILRNIQRDPRISNSRSNRKCSYLQWNIHQETGMEFLLMFYSCSISSATGVKVLIIPKFLNEDREMFQLRLVQSVTWKFPKHLNQVNNFGTVNRVYWAGLSLWNHCTLGSHLEKKNGWLAVNMIDLEKQKFSFFNSIQSQCKRNHWKCSERVIEMTLFSGSVLLPGS